MPQLETVRWHTNSTSTARKHELTGAIATLKQAIAEDKTPLHQIEKPMDTKADTSASVHLHQRAFPVLELMERALQEDTYVTWGV